LIRVKGCLKCRCPRGYSSERMVGPLVPCLVHAPAFRRSDRVIHGNRASCSSRHPCSSIIYQLVVNTPPINDRRDLFHAASGLPEHLFGPMDRPLVRRKIFKPFGSPRWPHPCTYPQFSPLRHSPVVINTISSFLIS
jgi:hypothetical protein